MSTDHRIMLGVTIAGFLVLMIGSVGYMGVLALDKTFDCVLMGIGIIAVIVGMAAMCFTKDVAE